MLTRQHFAWQNARSAKQCLLELPFKAVLALRFKPSTPTLTNEKAAYMTTLSLVGVTGLEPATSRPPAVRASQLRHTPICMAHFYYTLKVT